jgi:hypothetical protein
MGNELWMGGWLVCSHEISGGARLWTILLTFCTRKLASATAAAALAKIRLLKRP